MSKKREKTVGFYEKEIRNWSIGIYVFESILAILLIVFSSILFQDTSAAASGFVFLLLIVGILWLAKCISDIIYVCISHKVNKKINKNSKIKKMKANGTYYLLYGFLFIILIFIDIKSALFYFIFGAIYILFSLKGMANKK